MTGGRVFETFELAEGETEFEVAVGIVWRGTEGGVNRIGALVEQLETPLCHSEPLPGVRIFGEQKCELPADWNDVGRAVEPGVGFRERLKGGNVIFIVVECGDERVPARSN